MGASLLALAKSIYYIFDQIFGRFRTLNYICHQLYHTCDFLRPNWKSVGQTTSNKSILLPKIDLVFFNTSILVFSDISHQMYSIHSMCT